MAGIKGLEPIAYRLTAECSTIELYPSIYRLFKDYAIKSIGDLEGARTLDLQRDRLAF